MADRRIDLNPILSALIEKGLSVCDAKSFPAVAEITIQKDERYRFLRFSIFCGGCSLKEQVSFTESVPKDGIIGANWRECLDKWLKPQVDLPRFGKSG